jgi:capsular polysaccharide biosynthesis protein
MTEQAVNHYDEDEISLLDILVTLAESWKLLVFGPLIAGVLAGGLSFLGPKPFESVAIVRMTEEEVALLHAAPVLDPLIEKFGLLAEADGIVDDARQDLKKHLTFTVDKKTKLATVTAKGRSPESAQALGQAAMDILLIELQPKGKDKEAIAQEIAINNQLIADGVYLIDRQSGKQSNTNTNTHH